MRIFFNVQLLCLGTWTENAVRVLIEISDYSLNNIFILFPNQLLLKGVLPANLRTEGDVRRVCASSAAALKPCKLRYLVTPALVSSTRFGRSHAQTV